MHMNGSSKNKAKRPDSRWARRMFWSAPEMSGETFKYWVSQAGAGRVQFGCWALAPPFLFLLPILGWAISQQTKDLCRIAKTWRPNISRAGLRKRLWHIGLGCGQAMEIVRKTIGQDPSVLFWTSKNCGRSWFITALIKGGKESMGLSRLYITARESNDGCDIVLYGYKQFISPIESPEYPGLDAATLGVMAYISSCMKMQPGGTETPIAGQPSPEEAEKERAAHLHKGPPLPEHMLNDRLDRAHWAVESFMRWAEIKPTNMQSYLVGRLSFRFIARFFTVLLVVTALLWLALVMLGKQA
jgi:hypothetical protein